MEDDYRTLYREEAKKTDKLKARIEAENAEADEYQSGLDAIKNGRLWKISAPARSAIHWMQRTRDRVARYGSPRGIARKLSAKSIERKARLKLGTLSFPNAAERERQSSEVFP